MSNVLSRFTVAAAATVALVLSSAGSVAGQAAAPFDKTLEFRVPGGAFLPTGDQRETLTNSHLTAVQLSWVVRPRVAVTGTFGWARSRDVASIDHPKLDVFSSDVGIEARSNEWFTESAVSLTAFGGVGAGARSYNYRSLHVDATHNLAGYASVGGELGMGRVGLRVEVRDYLAGFKPLVGVGSSAMRNDVVIMAALSFNRN
jgi:hypothetical protein